MIERAYSVIHVKAMTEKDGYFVFEGMATTPTPDRMNDIVEPLGAKFAAKIPLLWQHDSKDPVGHAELGRPTKKGIPFVGKIPIVTEEGPLKERLSLAIQSIKYSLVSAVSIGFKAVNDAVERLKDGGLRFLETEIMELSLVTIPANSEAVISAVKSADLLTLSALGRPREGRDSLSPGATGKTKAVRRPIQLIPPRKLP